jgi:serine/threonine-protein kinase
VANDMVGGRYRLEQRLGVGGMSEVWAAEDTELGRRVAIKILGRDADAERFNREARAVAALAHPNICQLYDFGEEGGRPFMVLEYLGGGTLEDRLVAGEPYPDDETRRLAAELADALSHAHARGLVHRDLKPANVLFDDEGRGKIADFGIARLSGAGTLTEAGTLLGTAAYISPEQATGEPATPASDVYSLGVILYRLLSGRLPFESESAIELAEKHAHAQPPPLRSIRGDAPADLAAVAEEAMAKDPRQRPPDGAAVAALLGGGATAATIVAAAPAAGPTVVMPGRVPPPGRRTPLLPFVLIGALLLLGAGVAAAVIATRDSGSGSGPTETAPPLTTRRHTTTRATSQEAPTTRRATTTRATTTRPTTSRATTTRATTTTPTTAPPPTTTPPPTTAPPTTQTTTGSVSTPTTTAPPPPPPPTAP